MATEAAETFAAHYAALKDGVERLRSSDVGDIDALVATVEQVTRAHRGCRERIIAIRRMVGDQIGVVDLE